jgi:hypothetical protein
MSAEEVPESTESMIKEQPPTTLPFQETVRMYLQFFDSQICFRFLDLSIFRFVDFSDFRFSIFVLRNTCIFSLPFQETMQFVFLFTNL